MFVEYLTFISQDEQDPSHEVTHDIPSKPGEAKAQSYMSNILSKAKPSISNMSSLLRTKKKDEEKNKEDQRPLSQSSLAESVMSKGSTAKSYMSSVFKSKSDKEEETKSERPWSALSGSQSLCSMGSTIKSHFTSGLHSPVAEEEGGEKEEANEEKTKQNGGVTNTLRSKGSTAKLYVSNLLKPKPTESGEKSRNLEMQSPSRFSKVFKTKSKSTDKENPPEQEAKTEGRASSRFSTLLKFESKSTESESGIERKIEAEKQKLSKLSETLKAKGSNAKSFMANVIHSKSKEESRTSAEANGPKSDEKSKEYLRSKSSAVRSYLSKARRGNTKQKPVETPPKEDCKSKASLLKEKGEAGKTFLVNIFKRENSGGVSAEEAGGAASEVIKGKPATGASIIGHYPKTNKERSPGLKRDGSSPVKIDGFHANVVNRVEREIDMYNEEEPIQRCSVREYVKKYEEQHQLLANGVNNVRTECYTRPFKEFEGGHLSQAGGGGGPTEGAEVSSFGGNKNHCRGNNLDRQPEKLGNKKEIKVGSETNDEKSEKKGRNVRETFTRFSDNAMRMKKDGVEKAEHSWTGMRRRVRRLKLVRALRRRSDAEEEGEDGRIYLKDGKGKAIKKLYTFRKSSS